MLKKQTFLSKETNEDDSRPLSSKTFQLKTFGTIGNKGNEPYDK